MARLPGKVAKVKALPAEAVQSPPVPPERNPIMEPPRIKALATRNYGKAQKQPAPGGFFSGVGGT